jgi:hypothetical protein
MVLAVQPLAADLGVCPEPEDEQYGENDVNNDHAQVLPTID